MKHSLPALLMVCAALLLGSPATPARAATMILHNFTGGTSDGIYPYGSVTLSGSMLYGMTRFGGSRGSGALFSMNTDGTSFGLLHSFTGGASDGDRPYASLTLFGTKLYGMTNGGGGSNIGTLFSMNTDGTGFGVLHSFSGGTSDGRNPEGSLTLSGSKLYGMTRFGGSSNSGALFSMNTDGSDFDLLHSFSGGVSDGSYPAGSLTLSGSKLYGMTSIGGSSDRGTLFSMNTDGTGYGVIHSFTGGTSDGTGPAGSLTLSGSKLYGMTVYGGSGDTGALFSTNTDGTDYGLLHSFTGGTSDGSSPGGSPTLSGSTLYGMTFGGGSSSAGVLFSIDTDGSGFGLLDSFGGVPADGANPQSNDLTFSDDGSTLYGMTYYGGTAGRGVVFSRSIVPEPGSFALLGLGTLLLAARCRNARA